MSRLLCLAELLRHVRRDKSTRCAGSPRRKGLSTAPGVLSTPESPEGTAVSTSSQQVAHRLSTGINRSADAGAPFGLPRESARSSGIPAGCRLSAVMGPSGSGKSTLMHCMAGLDRPTSGHAYVGGKDIGQFDDAGLTRLRRDRIGFVFQYFNLVPTLTAAENITLPADLAGRKADREWLDFLVKKLGVADRLTHPPPAPSARAQHGVD